MDTTTKTTASTIAPTPSNPIVTTSRNLTIGGMTGDACVQKVRGVLNGVEDVTTQSVKVGSATIEADKAGCDAACKALDATGYKCHISKAGNTNTNDATKGDTAQKPGISNAAAPTVPARQAMPLPAVAKH